MLCVQGSQHALKWRNEPIYYHALVSCEREITQFVQEWNPYVQIELILFFFPETDILYLFKNYSQILIHVNAFDNSIEIVYLGV